MRGDFGGSDGKTTTGSGFGFDLGFVLGFDDGGGGGGDGATTRSAFGFGCGRFFTSSCKIRMAPV